MTKYFKQIGWAEGTSFLVLLLIAMPLKYMMGYPIAVTIVGAIHGLLFIVYILAATEAASDYGWSPQARFYSYVAAVLPFGPFVFDKKYLKP